MSADRIQSPQNSDVVADRRPPEHPRGIVRVRLWRKPGDERLDVSRFDLGRPEPALLVEVFDVPDTPATHVRIVVLAKQCTGNPAFQGSQDKDPLNGTDCREGSPGSGPVAIFGDLQIVAPRDTEVHIAELRVFAR